MKNISLQKMSMVTGGAETYFKNSSVDVLGVDVPVVYPTAKGVKKFLEKIDGVAHAAVAATSYMGRQDTAEAFKKTAVFAAAFLVVEDSIDCIYSQLGL